MYEIESIGEDIEKNNVDILGEESELEELTPWIDGECHQLRKIESSKMFCDNYENHELKYSVETLIPHIGREDLELSFIHSI